MLIVHLKIKEIYLLKNKAHAQWEKILIHPDEDEKSLFWDNRKFIGDEAAGGKSPVLWKDIHFNTELLVKLVWNRFPIENAAIYKSWDF